MGAPILSEKDKLFVWKNLLLLLLFLLLLFFCL